MTSIACLTVGPRTPDVGRRAGDEVLGEDLVLGQLEVVVLEQRGRQVRPSRRLVLQPGRVDGEAERSQFLGHGEDPADAVLAEVGERGEQRSVGVIEPVAEDVQVLVLAVDRAQLDGRDDPYVTRG